MGSEQDPRFDERGTADLLRKISALGVHTEQAEYDNKHCSDGDLNVNSSQEEDLVKLNFIQIPHLNDPGIQRDILDTEIQDRPDFVVRLGTSLARKNSDFKSRTLLKSLADKTKRLEVSEPGYRGYTSRQKDGRKFSLQRDRSLFNMSRALGKMSRARRKISVASMASESAESEILEDREKPYLKFQRLARNIRTMTRICLALKSYVVKPDRKEWSFMEMYLDMRDDLHQKVAFNPHSFVKVEPTRAKLRRLLSIPKHLRKLSDVQVILSLMRDNASFKDYPPHTQIQLASCMEYQSYEARRIILKQDHAASAFYILLSGSAIVNIRDIDPRTGSSFVRTVHEVKAGDTFGEIALLESVPRTATVICKTPCELLVVQKEDFDVIIKEPLLRERMEHIQFCRQLPLFSDFPCDVFAKYPNDFFFQHFRSGDIIVRDSRRSKYLVLVTEGKCQLVSDIKETMADRLHLPLFTREMEHAFPLYTELKKVQSKAPKPRAEQIQEDIQAKLLTGNMDQQNILGQTSQKKMTRKKSNVRLIRSNTVTEMFAKREQEGNSKTDVKRIDLPAIRQIHRSTQSFRHSADIRRPTEHVSRRHIIKSAYPPGRIHKSNDATLLSPEAVNQTLYAQISELTPGSVFGLESLFSQPSTTLSLVSQGAECILISKKIFLQEANIKVLRIVTDLIHNHPCHDYIKEQVYTYRKWANYKMDYILGVVNRRNSRECSFIGGAPDKKFSQPALAY